MAQALTDYLPSDNIFHEILRFIMTIQEKKDNINELAN